MCTVKVNTKENSVDIFDNDVQNLQRINSNLILCKFIVNSKLEEKRNRLHVELSHRFSCERFLQLARSFRYVQ